VTVARDQLELRIGHDPVALKGLIINRDRNEHLHMLDCWIVRRHYSPRAVRDPVTRKWADRARPERWTIWTSAI
jgi:hypothetical protein